jgi:hypothetical protein
MARIDEAAERADERARALAWLDDPDRGEE